MSGGNPHVPEQRSHRSLGSVGSIFAPGAPAYRQVSSTAPIDHIKPLLPFLEMERDHKENCLAFFHKILSQQTDSAPGYVRPPGPPVESEAVIVQVMQMKAEHKVKGSYPLEDQGFNDDPAILALGPGIWGLASHLDGGSQSVARTATVLVGRQPERPTSVHAKGRAYSVHWEFVQYLPQAVTMILKSDSSTDNFHQHTSCNASVWVAYKADSSGAIVKQQKDGIVRSVGMLVVFTDDASAHRAIKCSALEGSAGFGTPLADKWRALIHNMICSIDAYGLDDDNWSLKRTGPKVTVTGARARMWHRSLGIRGNSSRLTISYGLPHAEDSQRRSFPFAYHDPSEPHNAPHSAHSEYFERHTSSAFNLPSPVTSTTWFLKLMDSSARAFGYTTIEVEFLP